MTRAWLAAGLIFCAIAAITALAGESRVWKDKTGKFQVEAEYLGYADGKVQLKRADGNTITVPLSTLSTDDQAWVRAELKRAREAAAADKKAAAPTARGETTPVAAATKDWPQWRGPNRDGISTERGLLDSWPEEGPPLLWSAKGLGRGFSSVAVVGDTIYTQGERRGGNQVIALSTKDGSEKWSAPAGSGEPNGTPVVDNGQVFVVSSRGDLTCVETATGTVVWKKNYEQDFRGKMMSGWGYSETPLVDGDLVICTPGSPEAMIAALDRKNGGVAWTTPLGNGAGDQGQDGAAYSSVVVSHAAGVKQYVQLVGRGVVSVNAKNGQLLWGYNRIANGTANIPTPIVKGDYVFCSSGYGTGAALLKITGNARGLVANEVYFLEAQQMQNHHGGMILVGDYLYCGHGHNEGFPLCIEFLTGRTLWGGKMRGPGSGSAAIAYADGHLYFRYQNAVMALIEATPQKYSLKGTFKIASNHRESWAHPVIADGKLYLRDQDELHCYDIAKK